MRRQIKPFVTEYRANGRKAKEGAELQREGAKPLARWPDEIKDADTAGKGPLSYDAALRAADALFSRREPESGSAGTSAEPALARGEARAESAPRRILQSLEPEPSFIEDEPVAAPRRRGRKPGSKNKPKAVFVPLSGSEPTDGVASSQNLTGESLVPDLVAAQRTRAPADTRFAQPTPQRLQFSWIRKPLKRGEAWKKRLPKVVW